MHVVKGHIEIFSKRELNEEKKKDGYRGMKKQGAYPNLSMFNSG